MKQLKIGILNALALEALFLLMVLLLVQSAQGQYVDPFVARPIAQFQSGQEKECIKHWHEDLDILRKWQQEHSYWVGQYNQCAELHGLGTNYWWENPTLANYPVQPDLIEQDYASGRYSSLIKSCNEHVQSAHGTERQFANETYQVHINFCHCRGGKGFGACTANFINEFRYRYVVGQ